MITGLNSFACEVPGVGTPSLLPESSGDGLWVRPLFGVTGPPYHACRLFLRGVTGSGMETECWCICCGATVPGCCCWTYPCGICCICHWTSGGAFAAVMSSLVRFWCSPASDGRPELEGRGLDSTIIGLPCCRLDEGGAWSKLSMPGSLVTWLAAGCSDIAGR